MAKITNQSYIWGTMFDDMGLARSHQVKKIRPANLFLYSSSKFPHFLISTVMETSRNHQSSLF